MKNRSWGCSVTRTCLKNTVTVPLPEQERSTRAKPASSKGASTRQAEAMAIPTIDQSVTSKEDVDALNTLILRKLAKESFMNEGGSRKVEQSGASHCNKKASTRGTLHEARSATASCQCGSHVGKELFSSFPNLHSNTMYMDTTKSNPGSSDGGKISEGVGSLMTRIGLDNRERSEPELPMFQNSSRFDKVPQPRRLVATQDFLESIPSKDAGEWQGAIVHSSTEFLSLSTEQVTSTFRTTLVNAFAKTKTPCCGAIENDCIVLSTDMREGSFKERSNVSWAKETFVSIGSAGRSINGDNNQELFDEFEVKREVQARNILGRIFDANNMATNPQANNVESSLHAVGQMWCIPEANSVVDVMCAESSPYRRCSPMGTHEKATDLKSNPARPLNGHDELSPLENSLLKPHVNSPVHEEASLEEVIEQTSLHNALIKGMQLRIDEAAWNLQKSRSEQHSDIPIAGVELIRKIFKDEGVEEVISSKVPWPEQLKTAANVRWNLRELMKREEIEDDMDDLRTEYMSKQGIRELGCLEELARTLVGKQYDSRHEVSVGDHGTPGRLDLGIAKLKHDEVQLRGDSQEDTKTEPNTTPRNQLIPENKSRGFQVQKERIARRASPRQNHVRSSCPGDNCRNADAKLFQEKASLPDIRKSVISNDICDDPAAVQELGLNWETNRSELEVLLQFLTMKQQLREDRKTDVEAVVQTEAIVRELLARMKVDMDRSSSVDSDASICILPKSLAGEPVVEDGYGGGGRQRREEARSVDTCEDSVDPEVFADHQNQNIGCQSKPAIRPHPFAVPSSSKSQCLQRITGPTSTRKTTSCARNYANPSEECKATTSPSKNLEEARKRSRRSIVGARQTESCRIIQSAVGNAIDVETEKVKRDGSLGNVVEGGSSTATVMETVDGTGGATQVMGSAEPDGISNDTKIPHGSPTEDAMPLVSARNVQSRSFASNAPAMTPWNYQREKQLPIGRNVQLASPNKRSIPKSPSSPGHRRQCRDSPRKSSPNNRPSPLSSPNNRPSPIPSPNNRPSPLSSPTRQQKRGPATATSKSTGVQLGSPKRPSPLSSPQRQQELRPATATSKSTAIQLGSPKRPSPLSSPQRQQKPRPATATSKPTATQLGSPKRSSPLSSPQRQQKPRPATATSKSIAVQLGSPKRHSPLSSPQRQQKPRPATATLIPTAAHVGSPKISTTLAKEEADHIMSTAVSKPGSHDPNIFPTGISEAVVQESIALSKDSSDPYVDFRDSMLEMMQEKNLWQRQEELQDLLQCFLHLNQPVHHQIIHQAFSDVVSFGSPHKSSKMDRSMAHFTRRSSPSRQLYYEVSQPCKSPLRGGG